MSYPSLAKYAFCFQGSQGNFTAPIVGGSRTTPGKFGSRFAKLTAFLDPAHHGVKLTTDEYRRITLWLDLNSNELGAYTKVAEQRRGEVIWPELDCEPWNPLGAEVLAKDTTPPPQVTGGKALSPPAQLSSIALAWNPVADPESGIDCYNIYRNGARVATVFGSRYTDWSVVEKTSYTYEIAAVNRAGLEGAKSAAITATTPANQTPAANAGAAGKTPPTPARQGGEKTGR